MKSIFKTIAVVAIMLSPYIVQAQPPDGPSDPDTPSAPLDGGLSLLIAAGVGYGAKKAHQLKRNEKNRK